MQSIFILIAVTCLPQWPLAAATAGAQASCSDWNTKAFFCRLASLTFPVA